METSTMAILGILTALIGEQGIIYALQILHTPTEHGHTYLSVATGVNMILIGSVAGWLALALAGPLDLVLVIAVLLVSVGLLGGPMFIFQWLKRRQAEQTKKRINANSDFTND